MLHVFCDKKGSGKTKALIQSANEKINVSKGNIVYIDDDNRHILQLDRRIRFISTDEFNLKNYNSFYGFLCGIISEDYDVGTIYIDGLFNIVGGNLQDAAHLFYNIERLAKKNNVDFYLNISIEKDTMPDFIKKYVA
ncbi:hypothetical protein [Clostridium ganghwense]|uniref:Twitching motility protein PilT n=1 Tax=Clostridium ganghwense TaxID=312089 RepID=A0ABT4CPY0_9CLOT|nr:hypothetical protein [Clostridium ganghwense]MCY6371110.1 hypothetical protein [Clostridium ganghwense]